MLVLDAIERAGSLDSEKLYDALVATAFTGARGLTKFDENHNAILGVPVIEIKDGKKTFRYIVQPPQ
jgi:branched-chain amino acid transport system substrate-binding protein